jgi:hypothetical protein
MRRWIVKKLESVRSTENPCFNCGVRRPWDHYSPKELAAQVWFDKYYASIGRSVDRSLHCMCGDGVLSDGTTVEEKSGHGKVYPDLIVEIWHDMREPRYKPGWWSHVIAEVLMWAYIGTSGEALEMYAIDWPRLKRLVKSMLDNRAVINRHEDKGGVIKGNLKLPWSRLLREGYARKIDVEKLCDSV